MWQSLFHADKFIREVGIEVAENLGYSYPMQDDINVTEYISKIKALSKSTMDF